MKAMNRIYLWPAAYGLHCAYGPVKGSAEWGHTLRPGAPPGMRQNRPTVTSTVAGERGAGIWFEDGLGSPSPTPRLFMSRRHVVKAHDLDGHCHPTPQEFKPNVA